ncbi:hypothetical protein [Mesoplasma seiffertii]|uniref:hypothetical protein n=1 Tax=Mesoplasma seiffertii TaxID=28224 RepID=UPI00047E0FE0|nr:hypothetical protein [Mesoplasma seiffertii]
MNKKELKLKNKWLQKLRKALKLLGEDDANDIIDSYDEKITEEFNELKNMQIVLGQLADVKIIAREIYIELGIDYQTKPKRSKKAAKATKPAKAPKPKKAKLNSKSMGVKIAFTLPNILMAFLAASTGLVSLTFYATILTLVIVFPFMATILLITYDLIVALGLFILVLGIIPLVGILCWFMAKFFEKLTKGMINTMSMVYTEHQPFPKLFEKTLLSKIMLILALVFASILGFGAAINLAPENSVIASNYTGKYRYTQVTELDLSDQLKNPTTITLNYSGLSSYMYTNIIEKTDPTLKFGSIKLVRHYNIKEKYKLETQVEVRDSQTSNGGKYWIYLSSMLPWNAIIGVTSFEKYEVSYNFNTNFSEVD